ncbi:AAA family ATPase [Nostoc sp.]|uniref:AAA family ATPase n=1 Tax=Nostoc sp. TaxID=1180 RepID=UPI002FF6895A
MDMENYKLISLKVKGFRGFADRAGEREFIFDNSCTLLLGIQGGAKSSTLNAIEWCLFGDKVANKSATKIDERKDWLVKNKTSSEATVEVTFKRDDGELLKVYRCDRKRRGKPSFYYQTNDGIHEDENRLAVLLGIELSDYMSCIYLHQEVINALLVQEPKERRNALDRLMGLTNWRNLGEGIKNAKATDQFKKIDEDYAKINHKIETAKKIKQGDLATAKEEAMSHDIAEKELTLDGAKSRCKTVAETMQRFANDYSLLLPMLPKYQTNEDLEKFFKSGKQAIKKLRNEQPDVERQKALLSQENELTRLKVSFDGKRNAEKQQDEQIQKFKDKHGTPSSVLAKKNQIENEHLPVAREGLYTINNKAGVIRETLKFLDSGQDTESHCPICSNKITPSKLRQQIEASQKEMQSQIKPFETEISRLETELSALSGVIKKFEHFQGDLEDKRQDIRDAKKAIAVALETEISEEADPLVLLEQAITEVSKDLAEIRQAIQQGNHRIDVIEEQLEDIKRITNMLQRRQEVEKLFEIQDSPEYKQFESERDKLSSLCDSVVTIGEAIEDVLRTSAKEKIESTKNLISNIYRQLAIRTDYPDIKIDSDKYEVMAVGKGETEIALRILNKGDINCAALSIFLGLATSNNLTHNISFMVLDDPSQNLDPAHKERLAGVLNDVLKNKQLIIATSEDDFATHLNSKLTKPKKVYRLEDWTEDDGPSITVE